METPLKIGPFELRREIGRGSSGVVHEAFDPEREIRAAVKHYVLAPPPAAGVVSRLHRDAQAAGALGHPNIAAVIGLGEHEGRPWVASELVTGVSLAQLARSRAHWPIERILDLWRQLCEGLAHAHREGLLHLDLKPSDVRVNTDGDVKVLDFGAWHLKSTERPGGGRADAGLRYRPPEVVAGRRPDRRADIFAVAAIVYELVTRRRAFPGDSTTDVIRSVARCEPDLATLPSSAFSPGFERMLAQSLARDPGQRPGSFEDVHADLVQLVRDTAPRLRESAPTSTGARPERDSLLAELTRARAEDRLEDALDVCRRLLALDPEDEAARRAFPEVESVIVSREADALVGEALALAADGDIDSATRIAEKVERLAPWSPRYLQLQVYLDEEGARRRIEDFLETARAHLAAGRAWEARAAVEDALGLMPWHEGATRLLEELAAAEAPTTSPVHGAETGGTPTHDARGGVQPPAVQAHGAAPRGAQTPEAGGGGAAADAGTPAGGARAAGARALADPSAAVPAEPVAGGPLAAAPPAEPERSAPPAKGGTAGNRRPNSRKSEAEALTAEALRHFTANEHKRAREAVDRALDLDPVNRRALELQRILRVLG